MAFLTSRPALRWLVPAAAAVVVIGGGAAAGTLVANADPTLPERSAAQLLADLQTARVDGLSGTLVQSADLGLPALPGLTDGAGAELTRLITSNNTVRVWYAGDTQARVALLSPLGQMDLIRNGSDVWLWNSKEKTASHYTVPADAKADPRTEIAPTPQAAADAALAAIDPTTKVTTTGTAEVAGRDAYELVIAPRDTESLIGQVRLAIDGEHKIPLRAEVYPKGSNEPAFKVAFEQIAFAKPDAQQFTFNPPPGTKVTEEQADADATPGKATPRRDQEKPALTDAQKKALAEGKAVAEAAPNVIGSGWTSIFTAKAPVDQADGQASQLINSLPKVNGTWGSGRLFSSKLFTALLTDDGRVFAGAVAPEKLYEAAAKK